MATNNKVVDSSGPLNGIPMVVDMVVKDPVNNNTTNDNITNATNAPN